MTDLEERDKLMKRDTIYSAIIGRGDIGIRFTLKEWWGNIWQI